MVMNGCYDENGKLMSEEDKIREALDMLADVLAMLYETESDQGHAAAFMADGLVKYLTVCLNGDNVLLAAADYQGYEQMVYHRENGLTHEDKL